jgi:dipeptidyl aminopeptidase/acylaminoacyl peptidase
MDRASPVHYLQEIQARVLVMHDQDDELVPVEESRRLVAALAGREDLYYTEFSLFDHVDPTARASPFEFAGEVLKLVRHIFVLLREAT